MNKYKHSILYSLLGMMIIAGCFVLIDLYRPIKTLISGNEISSIEFWSYVNLGYGDWIIISLFGVGILFNKKNHKKNKAQSSV